MGAYFNKKAYTDPALRKEYTNKGFWVNIRLIRYSDVVLMAAEAANEKNIPGEAIDYLEWYAHVPEAAMRIYCRK